MEVESGLKDLPAWIDLESCAKMLTRRERKSLNEVHGYRLTVQVSDLYRAGRYKNDFKACTSLFRPPKEDDQRLRGVTSKKGRISVKKAIKFKPACSKSALRVASKKMKLRADVGLVEKQAQTTVGDDSNNDESDESGNDKEDGKLGSWELGEWLAGRSH